MRNHRSAARRRQTAPYIETLRMFSLRQLPLICNEREDIERILALRSAALLEATTAEPVQLRTGERFIPSATVTGITSEGRLVLGQNGGRRSMLALPPMGR